MRSVTPSENSSTNHGVRGEGRRVCRRGTLYRYMCDEMGWGLLRRKDGRTDGRGRGRPVRWRGAGDDRRDGNVRWRGRSVGRFTSVAAAVVSGDSVREREEG